MNSKTITLEPPPHPSPTGICAGVAQPKQVPRLLRVFEVQGAVICPMSSGSGLRIQWIPKSPTSYTEPSVRYHVHCRNPPRRVYRSCVGIFPHQEKVQAEDTPQPARPSAYITLARYVAPIRLGNAAPHLPRALTGVAREMYSPLSMPYRMKVFTSYGRAIRIPVLFGVRTVYGSMYPRLMRSTYRTPLSRCRTPWRLRRC